MVEQLATEGISGDVIAARLGVNKNTLRARHALRLKAGRDAKIEKRAAAEAVTRSERARLHAIKGTFDSHWYHPKHGNLIFGGTHSVEEALAWCEEHNPGPCRWITTGLSDDQFD